MRFSTLVVLAAVVGLAAASCPNSCSGHGRCGQYDKCTCFYRWMAPDCSQRMCKEGLAWANGDQYNPHGWSECSNKGTCDRSSGECVCFAEYEGAACERSSCPNGCSGHGTCEYAHEINTMATSDWEYNKIQSCRCDGGWEGQDCSQRRCPRGDDPLTTQDVLVYDGDSWDFTLTATPAGTNYLYVEVVDMYGTTHRSRAISYVAGTANYDMKFEYALLDMPCFTSFKSATLQYSGGVLTGHVTLWEPTRVTDFRIKTDMCTAGCYPYMPAQSTAVTLSTLTVSNANTGSGYPTLLEAAECSNRGVCDRTLGQCVCFPGHFGLACETQSVLV